METVVRIRCILAGGNPSLTFAVDGNPSFDQPLNLAPNLPPIDAFTLFQSTPQQNSTVIKDAGEAEKEKLHVADGIHLTNAGYAVVAGVVAAAGSVCVQSEALSGRARDGRKDERRSEGGRSLRRRQGRDGEAAAASEYLVRPFAGGWIGAPALNPFRLAAGAPPWTDGEVALWPGFTFDYWRRTRRFELGDYEVRAAPERHAARAEHAAYDRGAGAARALAAEVRAQLLQQHLGVEVVAGFAQLRHQLGQAHRVATDQLGLLVLAALLDVALHRYACIDQRALQHRAGIDFWVIDAARQVHDRVALGHAVGHLPRRSPSQAA